MTSSVNIQYPAAQLCDRCKEIFESHWISRDEANHRNQAQNRLVEEDASNESSGLSDIDEDECYEESSSVSSEPDLYDVPDWVVLERPLIADAVLPLLYSSPSHHTIAELKVSADSGCYICMQFNDMVRHRLSNDETMSRLWTVQPRAVALIRPSSDGRMIQFELLFYEKEGGEYCFREELTMYRPSDPPSDYAHMVRSLDSSTSRTPSRSRQQIKSWIAECDNNHPNCHVTDHQLPSRLLKICSGKDDNTSIRLVATPTQVGKYATLSHCWGGSQPVKLMTGNCSAFKRNIDFKSLPQTFRDSMALCISLDIAYIWIDSLCIIQDSKEDWQNEALRMAMVYRNAHVNIAATSSKDCHGGLFHQSDLFQSYSIDATWTGVPPGHYLCIDPGADQRRVQEAPLNVRAWVFQERSLSHRILHCAYDQLWWSCQVIPIASEAFPTGAPRLTHSSLPSLADLQTFGNEMPITDFLKAVWNLEWLSFVSFYSKAKLTFGSDKLIAFAGLALAAAETRLLPSSEYLAGHWKEDLPSSLLWRTDCSHPQRPAVWRAPSWSWASVDGSVLFPSADARGHLRKGFVATVLDAHVTPVIDPFGALTDGHLRISGPVFPIVLRGIKPWHLPHSADRALEYLDFDGKTYEADNGYNDGFIEFIDHEPSYHGWPAEGRKLFYGCMFAANMPIHSNIYPSEGLILEAIDGVTNEYRRIGLLRVPRRKPWSEFVQETTTTYTIQ